MTHRRALAAAAVAVLLLVPSAMARAPYVMAGVEFQSECIPAEIVWLAGQPTCPAVKVKNPGKIATYKLDDLNVLDKSKTLSNKVKIAGAASAPVAGKDHTSLSVSKARAQYLYAKSKAKLKAIAIEDATSALAEPAPLPTRRSGGSRLH